MAEKIVRMESQGMNAPQNQEPPAAPRAVTKPSLGLGAAVLAGLAVAAGFAAPAAMDQQPREVPLNVTELLASSTTCCPPDPQADHLDRQPLI